jgi:hypothetical protein
MESSSTSPLIPKLIFGEPIIPNGRPGSISTSVSSSAPLDSDSLPGSAIELDSPRNEFTVVTRRVEESAGGNGGFADLAALNGLILRIEGKGLVYYAGEEEGWVSLESATAAAEHYIIVQIMARHHFEI